jgi:hypothetical protein
MPANQNAGTSEDVPPAIASPADTTPVMDTVIEQQGTTNGVDALFSKLDASLPP